MLVKVTSVFLSCSIFSPKLSHFSSEAGEVDKGGEMTPQKKKSWRKKKKKKVSHCPSIMIVDLGFAKLLPSFSTFSFLFETYAAFI